MATVDDGMFIRVNRQKWPSLYVGSESLRIIVEETRVRFAIVLPGWSRASKFPEVSNPAVYFQGDLPGTFIMEPDLFGTGRGALAAYLVISAKSASAFHIVMQPNRATWNLTIRI